MTPVIAAAPASTFLFGEHAVLAGYPAVLCALNQWLTVTLTPSHADRIDIHSALGSLSLPLNQLTIRPPLTFITAALCHYAPLIKNGFTLEVKSEFSSEQGLASSAAATVAMVMALRTFLALPTEPTVLFKESRDIMLNVQKKGSGADLAAAIYGGCLAFQQDTGFIRHFEPPAFTLVYSGSKTKTTTVIEQVAKQLALLPEVQNKIHAAIGACAIEAQQALLNHDEIRLGTLAKVHQGLQIALQTSTPLLNELIFEVEHYSTITGAKISGSGLGDCIVAFGELPTQIFPQTEKQKNAGVLQLSIPPTLRGAYVKCT